MPDAGLAMGCAEQQSSFVEAPLCPVCDDVVGVYEPLVHLGEGLATWSSRAAEPEICSDGQCYHLDCYVQLANESRHGWEMPRPARSMPRHSSTRI